jgi:hypothetical protein
VGVRFLAGWILLAAGLVLVLGLVQQVGVVAEDGSAASTSALVHDDGPDLDDDALPALAGRPAARGGEAFVLATRLTAAPSAPLLRPPTPPPERARV